MSEAFFTPDYVTQYVAENPDDIVMSGFSGAFMNLLPQHAAAVALVDSTNGDNVGALATSQWEASDTPEAREYRELQSKIAAAMAKLQPFIDQADSLKSTGVAEYQSKAEAYAQANGANAKQKEAGLRKSIEGLIANLPYPEGSRPEFPALPKPGKSKSASANGGNRGRKAGSLDWHLATATVNGNPVAFTGDNVTLSNIAKSIGCSRDTLDNLLRANLNGNVQSPAPGASLTVKVGFNSAEYVIGVVGRETKPRGRKAKVTTDTATVTDTAA